MPQLDLYTFMFVINSMDSYFIYISFVWEWICPVFSCVPFYFVILQFFNSFFTTNEFFSKSFLESLFEGSSLAALLNGDYHLYLLVGLSVLFSVVAYLFFFIAATEWLTRKTVAQIIRESLDPVDVQIRRREMEEMKPAPVYFTECPRSEEFWVVFFSFIVFFQGFSYGFNTLYTVGLPEIDEPHLTIQAIGNQWFWTFNYTDFLDINDKPLSLEVRKVDELGSDTFPPLENHWEVNKRIFIPNGLSTRFVVNSSDVIHSFFIRDLELKIDANPNRINEVYTTPLLPGVYPGYCTELCGSGHGLMPFTVQVVHPFDFMCWVKYQAFLLALDSKCELKDLVNVYQFNSDDQRILGSVDEYSVFWSYFMDEVQNHPFWADERYEEVLDFLRRENLLWGFQSHVFDHLVSDKVEFYNFLKMHYHGVYANHLRFFEHAIVENLDDNYFVSQLHGLKRVNSLLVSIMLDVQTLPEGTTREQAVTFMKSALYELCGKDMPSTELRRLWDMWELYRLVGARAGLEGWYFDWETTRADLSRTEHTSMLYDAPYIQRRPDVMHYKMTVWNNKATPIALLPEDAFDTHKKSCDVFGHVTQRSWFNNYSPCFQIHPTPFFFRPWDIEMYHSLWAKRIEVEDRWIKIDGRKPLRMDTVDSNHCVIDRWTGLKKTDEQQHWLDQNGNPILGERWADYTSRLLSFHRENKPFIRPVYFNLLFKEHMRSVEPWLKKPFFPGGLGNQPDNLSGNNFCTAEGCYAEESPAHVDTQEEILEKIRVLEDHIIAEGDEVGQDRRATNPANAEKIKEMRKKLHEMEDKFINKMRAEKGFTTDLGRDKNAK